MALLLMRRSTRKLCFDVVRSSLDGFVRGEVEDAGRDVEAVGSEKECGFSNGVGTAVGENDVVACSVESCLATCKPIT
jgi:hypothetical protein